VELRKIREKKKIGLNELARTIGVSPSYLSQLERGIKSNPSKETMEKIAAALKKPVQEVFFSGKGA
jgi:transcriptional regulator with XRE-family HTH domain